MTERRDSALLEQIVEAIPTPIFWKDRDGTYRGCNSRFAAYLGLPRDQIVGHGVYDVAPAPLAEIYAAADSALIEAGEPQVYEARVRYADGSEHDVMFHKAALRDAAGEVCGLVGAMFDITDRKRAEEELRAREERYRSLALDVPFALAVVTPDGRVSFVNPAFRALFRLRDEDVPTLAALLRRLCPDARERRRVRSALGRDLRAAQAGRRPRTRELRVTCGDGLQRDVEMGFALVVGSRYLVFHEISEQRAAEIALHEVLHVQAASDALTGLLNRRSLDAALPREIARARRRGEPLAVVMADIDRFKAVNDLLGHRAGDKLLRSVAQCLADNVRDDDLVCRYGGDEFTLVLRNTGLDSARRRAQELRRALRETPGAPTMSFGVATLPEHGVTAERLMATADAGLLQAKRQGRDRVVSVAPAAG